MNIAKNTSQAQCLFPVFEKENFHVTMFRWQEWAKKQGLKKTALDFFINSLGLLESRCPELFYSEELQVSLTSSKK